MKDSVVKEPVKLRRKVLRNGNVSLYLAVYVDGRRSYEFLKLYLIPEKSREDKLRNKATLELANSVKAQRIVEVQQGRFGMGKRKGSSVLLFDYMDRCIEERAKRNPNGTCVVWRNVMKHLKVYEGNASFKMSGVTAAWVKGFKEYLEGSAVSFRGGLPLERNTQWLYFSKLKAMVHQALADGVLDKDPFPGVGSISKEEVVRQHLSIEEVRCMAKAECGDEGLKRAFLFSCLTGLRRSDIEKLTWGEVVNNGGRTRLVFRQKKTGGQEYLDLSGQAAELLGGREDRRDDERVFPSIPTPTRTKRLLREWSRAAGIDKVLTFHCARHTFAVMMLTLGTDIYTVSKLLGHRDLATTQVYAKIVDAKKAEAVDNIPRIL